MSNEKPKEKPLFPYCNLEDLARFVTIVDEQDLNKIEINDKIKVYAVNDTIRIDIKK